MEDLAPALGEHHQLAFLDDGDLGADVEMQVGVGAGRVGDEHEADGVVVQEDHLLDLARRRLGQGLPPGERDQREQDTEGDEARHGRSPHRGSTGYPRFTHPRNPSARTLAFWKPSPATNRNAAARASGGQSQYRMTSSVREISW